MQLITPEERSIHQQTKHNLGSDSIWWSRLQTPSPARQGWDICITMSHMLREEWAGRGIWPTQQPHWDTTLAASLVQTHQGRGRWGQSSPTAEEESTVDKVLTFTSKQHLQAGVFEKCYTQVAAKLLNLSGSWDYLGWTQGLENNMPTLSSCTVLCQNKKENILQKTIFVKDLQKSTHKIEQWYVAGWPPLGMQSSTHSVTAAHPTSNHILISCVVAAVRGSQFCWVMFPVASWQLTIKHCQ